MLKVIGKEEFNLEVTEKKGVVLVDFFATWCPPCKMLGPVLEEIANSRSEFDILKVNIDENQELALKYGVEVVPTMIIFKDGVKVDTLVGFMSKEAIVEKVQEHI